MSRGRKACNIYCIHCGTENKKSDKRCKKCHRKLKSWNILFFSFFSGQLRSNTLDIVIGDIFDTIKNFLINCSFGVIFTVSVAFTSITTVVNYLESNPETNDDIKVVDNKFTIVNTCKYDTITDMVYTCPSNYTLNNNNFCEKITKEYAKENKICEGGYKLVNNKCISNEATPMIETPSCDAFSGYSHDIPLNNGKITIHKENLISAEIDSKRQACNIKWCKDPETIDWEIKECLGTISGTDYDKDLYHIKKSCPSNQTEINGVCHKTTNYKTEYTCDNGELNGKKCIIEDVIEATYTCPAGYSYNEECKGCVGDNNG